MKLKNIFLTAFAVVAGFCLVGCKNNNRLESPHTDASTKVVGTYEGVMTLGAEEVTDDVVVTVTHIDADTIQAVTLQFVSAAKSMDQTIICNVAAANDRFVLVPACSSKDAARNTSAILENEVLTVTTTLNSKFVISAGSSAKRYTLLCTKK